jgi:hypothetical protein
MPNGEGFRSKKNPVVFLFNDVVVVVIEVAKAPQESRGKRAFNEQQGCNLNDTTSFSGRSGSLHHLGKASSAMTATDWRVKHKAAPDCGKHC